MPAVSAWRVLSATLARLPKSGRLGGTHTPQASDEFLQEGSNPEARVIQKSNASG